MKCNRFFHPKIKKTTRILQQIAELIQPENTKTVMIPEKTIEPSAVENKTASPRSGNFNPQILFERSWPELWKARKIRRNNAKSISTVIGESEMKISLSQPTFTLSKKRR